MKRSRFTQFLSVVLSFVVAFSFAFPVAAIATEKEVQIENHAAGGAKTVSGITIDDVEAPQAGKALDDKATVRTAEGESWEIPVLWIADNLQLATEAQEGATYLPALAFFVPQDYAVEGGAYTVELSDSLAKLFGSNEVISVYNPSTGITYILPASLKNYFAVSRQGTDYQEAQLATSEEDESEPLASESYAPNLVDVYCAQTARDALTDEDLSYLIDLILNYLEPQAVELLLDSFPAFRAGADNGQIGTEISMYIYYEKGDQDGLKEHQSAESALAYVSGDPILKDGTYVFCYMIGIDVDSLLKKENKQPVHDSTTGKFVLLREGEDMLTFENTIVHELFHAVMDDYNRTGMAGTLVMGAVKTDEKGDFLTPEDSEMYTRIAFPTWFIEGTASAVENVYQFRYDLFKALRAERGSETEYSSVYTADDVLYNYLNARQEGKDVLFDLYFCLGVDEDGNKVNNTASAYVSGYLATLYLSELAARQAGESAVQVDGDSVTISSEKLRMGLNSILERMHNGETLDQVIYDLSPVDAKGNKLYKNADDFQDKFIKGVPDSKDYYYGDNGANASLEFVVTYLNYMNGLEGKAGEGSIPNGSLLLDFETYEESPLDPTKASSSEYLKIVESNEYVQSTVPDSEALKGGGKSESGTPSAASASQDLPAAAKAQDTHVIALDAADGAGAVAPESLPLAAKAVAGDGEVADEAAADGEGPAAVEAAAAEEGEGAAPAEPAAGEEEPAAQPAEPNDPAAPADEAPVQPAACEATVPEPVEEEAAEPQTPEASAAGEAVSDPTVDESVAEPLPAMPA